MKSASILLADDEDIFREMTAKLLRARGYVCDTVEDSDNAVKALHSQEYQLFITDIKMPGNYDLAFFHQYNHLFKKTPTIVVTAFPSIDTAIDSLRNGICDYLFKPIDFNELIAKIEKVLSKDRIFNQLSRLLLDPQKSMDPGSETDSPLEEPDYSLIYRRVARNLKTIRLQRGLRQTDVARISSIDQRHFQKIEGGHSDVRLSTLVRLAQVLQVSVQTLLSGGDKVNSLEGMGELGLNFKNLFDHFSTPVIFVDEKHHIANINDAGLIQFGFPHGQMIGKPLSRFIDSMNGINRDDLRQSKIQRALLKSPHLSGIEVQVLTEPITDKSGRYYGAILFLMGAPPS